MMHSFGRPRNQRLIISKTFFASAIWSTLLVKHGLLESIWPLRGWQQYLVFPLIFLPDILMFIALHWWWNRQNRISSKARFNSALSIFIISVLIISFNMCSIVYYQYSGVILDWRTVFSFVSDSSNCALLGFAADGAQKWTLIHILILLINGMSILLYRHIQETRYQQVDGMPIYSPDHEEDYYKEEFKPWYHYTTKKACFGGAILVCGLLTLFKPTFGSWNKITRPIPWAVIDGILFNALPFYGRLFKSSPRLKFKSYFKGSVKDMYTHCHTIKATLNAYFSGQVDCPIADKVIPDLSFVQRTNDSQIRNVIFIILESGRNDLFPLNPNSPWVKSHFNSTFIRDNPLTPFLSQWYKEGIWYDDVRTISTYTQKAVPATLCSHYPIVVDRTMEAAGIPYTQCLPGLLERNGWTTMASQASTWHWDWGFETNEVLGFHRQIGESQIYEERLAGVKVTNFEKVNSLGYDDFPLVPPLINWIKEQREANKPFFLTLQNSVAHGPFKTPSSWPYFGVDTIKNPKVRDFINAVRYTDEWARMFVEGLESNNYLEDTLVVVVGDHGVTLDEHGDIPGTNEREWEELIKVNALFYSKNKAWRQKYPSARISGTISNLDLLPTVLEMLDEKNVVDKNLLAEHYEGQSLLHIPYKGRYPLYFTTANPGAYSLMFNQGDYKVVTKPNSQIAPAFYDLFMDPNEQDPKEVHELKDPAQREWMESIVPLEAIITEMTWRLWNYTGKKPNEGK